MLKSQRNRSDLSARNSQNPHLSSEQILLFLDGELSSRETTQTKAHLEACWSCRVRSEKVGEVIADVVAYRDCFIKPNFPVSADTRTTFVMRLRQLVRSFGKPTFASRILDLLRALQTFSQSEIVPRHVWISGIVIAAFTFLLLARFSEVPRVSASQFLENARASEVRALDGIAKPVVYQKLHIRLGNQAVTRTIYHDLEGNHRVDFFDRGGGREVDSGGGPLRRTSRPNSGQLLDAGLEQKFRTEHLNWADPLSPVSYDAWRNSLSRKQDYVTQVNSEFLTLKTTTPEGPIKEATITVRTGDFHPVAEILYMNDTQQVEITELAWQVIPMEAINSDIFASEHEHVPSPVTVRATLPISTGPTDAELAEAELRARVAIHAEDADLGEQIEFERNPSNVVHRYLVIRGIVSTPARKAELSAALEGIPNVELRLHTIEEVALRESQLVGNNPDGPETQQGETPDFTVEQPSREPDSQGDHGQKPAQGNVVVGKPALEVQLEGRFPKPEERIHFVNNAVELAQDCLAQAWALRRLQDHYTAEEVTLLSHGSRQTLELLIHDHVSALRQHVDAVRDSVFPLLTDPREAALPITTTEVHPVATEPTNDWRSSVTVIFPKVQSIEIQVVDLLAGPGESLPDVQGRVRELRLALVELETQLPVLYQRVNGPFLSEDK